MCGGPSFHVGQDPTLDSFHVGQDPTLDSIPFWPGSCSGCSSVLTSDTAKSVPAFINPDLTVNKISAVVYIELQITLCSIL